MAFQDVLALVPLLLSYPTIILSGDLILPRSSPSVHYNVILDHIVRLIILPLFAVSGFVGLGYTFKVFKESCSLFPVFVIGFVICQLNFILGTIQATCISLLTIRLILWNNGNDSFEFKHLLKIYSPLLLLSLAINGGSAVVGPVLSYSALLLLLRFGYPKRDYFTKKDNKSMIISSAVISFVGLFLVSTFNDNYSLQLLMVFVFIGCVGIFFVSIKDALSEIENNTTIQVPQCAILLSGLMAIVLQYLSFNAIASSKLADLFTLIFTFATELVSTFFVQSSPVSCHNHSHNQDKSKDQLNSDSIFKQIAMNKDTRSIFSFLMLNTTFMFVQLLYSFRSKSLGLLSDSLHMALDCTSLLLGLIAGVLSKRAPSDKFPFALGYLETLAGFTNGVLLLGIVCGIFVEAMGRLLNPVHIHGTNELLVVATLGLFVNLLGLFAFDHGGHSHNCGNENMRGIFLHILADTLGSVGVVVSTLLIKWTHFHIFDPIASIFIGTLILLSAIPLLKSTACSILLMLDQKKHNVVKNALNQISTTPGISGYTTPRFWPAASQSSSHSHGHSHGHSHDHSEKEEENCHDDHIKKVSPCLVGYIHVQFVEGENSTIVKKRVEKIFESVGINAWIQVEPCDSPCWCRTPSLSQNMIPQVISNQ